VTNVVFLSHTGADSGAEQSTVAALAHWPSSDPPPAFVVGRSGPIEDRATSRGVDCQVLEVGAAGASVGRSGAGVARTVAGLVGLLRHAPKVRRLLRARSTDIVVATSLKSLVFGWLATRGMRTTLVWSLHDRVSGDYFSHYLVPVLRSVLPRGVDGVVVNSRSTLATIRPRGPVLVSPPAIELDQRTFREPAREVRRVVMVGRLASWKGQDLFLDAFAEAFADGPVEAVVVGGPLFGEDDYEAELRAQAERLGVQDRVRFVGQVADPWDFLVDADIAVHASRIPEPFGMVVVQGMWARCAVVATTPGGPAEVITDGVDGLLVPTGDVRALTSALSTLRDDPRLRARLADAGHAAARELGATVTTPVLRDWLVALHEGRLAPRSVTDARQGAGGP
jgi:glycosyltransferase involved in cell wall biosynthesis